MANDWQTVFRAGFAPALSTPALEALAKALRTDDPSLVQGETTVPAPLQCVQDWPVEAACGIAFGCWRGDELTTVAEVEQAFAESCGRAELALGCGADVAVFLRFFDETPRAEMICLLLPEVERCLAERAAAESTQEEGPC